MANKTEAIYVRLEPRLKALLQEQADKEHRAVSNLIAKVLIDYCETKAPAKKLNGHHPAAKPAPAPQS